MLFNCGWDAIDSKKWEEPAEIRLRPLLPTVPKATVQPSLCRDPQIQVSLCLIAEPEWSGSRPGCAEQLTQPS